MSAILPAAQKNLQKEVAAWVDEVVAPFSNDWEETQSLPREVIDDFAERGYFGAAMPKEWGGLELDNLSFGLLCAEIARGSVSLLSRLTVHNMTSQAILRWGTDTQKSRFLPAMTKGKTIGAFALTEPDIGSDAVNIKTRITESEGGFLVDGTKQWTSQGDLADLFLVMGGLEEGEGAAAILVERTNPGLTTEEMKGLLGFRAAGVSKVTLDKCQVPADNLVGNLGGGFTYVASYALDHGRYTVGWGGVGVLDGCLQSSVEYASRRKQFDQTLRSHQLIQEMLANMAMDYEAAKALATQCAAQREAGDPDSIMTAAMAKYFSSRACLRSASDAVQIHGGNGCGPEYPVQRYFRDAKICEIIEGSSQMQQLMISRSVCMSRKRRKRKRREK